MQLISLQNIKNRIQNSFERICSNCDSVLLDKIQKMPYTISISKRFGLYSTNTTMAKDRQTKPCITLPIQTRNDCRINGIDYSISYRRWD